MIRKYKKSDFSEVSSWFQARNVSIEPGYLPEHGFIIPGKAAGFIYKTDANFCIFECFVRNPKISKSDSEQALTRIVEAMIKESKELGFKDAYGFATSQNMIRRGMEQGFKLLEMCSMIVKDLR